MQKNHYKKVLIKEIVYSFDGVERDFNQDFIFYIRKDKKNDPDTFNKIHDIISNHTGLFITDFLDKELSEFDFFLNSDKVVLDPYQLF